MIIGDLYPIQRMGECIDTLGVVMTFLTLDAYSRYWQKGIAMEDHDKTVFTSLHGLSSFTRIPYGFK